MTLRPMTMADADLMLEWKNYHETKKFSILLHHEDIKKEDHYLWLSFHLPYFQIINASVVTKVDINGATGITGPAGAIRIQDNEISIWVDRNFRGHQIASKALKLVATEGMIAKIVDGNIPSMRAFINAGFKPIEYVNNSDYRNNYYIFKK